MGRDKDELHRHLHPLRAGRTMLARPPSQPVDGFDVMMVTISGPIRQSGPPAGIMTGDMALTALSDCQAQAKPFGNGTIALARDKGIRVAHSDRAHRHPGRRGQAGMAGSAGRRAEWGCGRRRRGHDEDRAGAILQPERDLDAEDGGAARNRHGRYAPHPRPEGGRPSGPVAGPGLAERAGRRAGDETALRGERRDLGTHGAGRETADQDHARQQSGHHMPADGPGLGIHATPPPHTPRPAVWLRRMLAEFLTISSSPRRAS